MTRPLCRKRCAAHNAAPPSLPPAASITAPAGARSARPANAGEALPRLRRALCAAALGLGAVRAASARLARLERGELLTQPAHELVDVGHLLAVGDDAEVHRAEVAHDGD